MTIQSFFVKVGTEIETEASNVLTAAKADINAIEGVFVADVEPAIESGLSATYDLLKRNGGQLLMTAAVDALGLLTGSSWAVVAAQVVTAAKAAGAVFVAGEEQLAASTAMQIQQNLQATPAAVTPPATAA